MSKSEKSGSMKNIIKASWFTPTTRGWGLTLALVGSPGVSKSAQVVQAAKEWGFESEVLSPGERGEGAFGVVPVPVGEGDKCRLAYPAPDWVDKFAKGRRGVVVLEELTTASPALQPALLGISLDKRIGTHQFGPNVRVMAIYNPPAEAAAGYELSMAQANRLGHLEFDAGGLDEYADYLNSVDAFAERVVSVKDANAEEARVLLLWNEEFTKAKGKVLGFLRARPEFLHKQPKADDPQASRAWSSRRSIEMATRALASSIIHELSETEQYAFFASFVGDGMAGEFFAWLEAQDLPNPYELLDGKVTFEHNSTRLDRTQAVLAACVSCIASEKDAKVKRAWARKLWELLYNVTNANSPGIVWSPAKLLGKIDGLATPEARKVTKALGGDNWLKEAGLVNE
jgi:hypothetical protein